MAPKLKTRVYRGESVNVTYDIRRCIHAEECVTRLGEVFDMDKRPWIQPDQAPVEQVVETIGHCPTGALHYERLDGGPGEEVPGINTVVLHEDGPVYLSGNLIVQNVDGEQVYADTRIALCRCGVAENKPFCDNSHLKINFKAPATAEVTEDDQAEGQAGEALIITPQVNGPVHIEGNFEMRSQDGQLISRGSDAWLCRCGGSENKPFCDGTHRRDGFEAESW